MTWLLSRSVLSRPTHKNTSWDAAKFEVCGHRWADLSEFGYGVALLNDCKYGEIHVPCVSPISLIKTLFFAGYACEGNLLRISLLRAATAPDENQDQGFHEFSFAVLPHRGSFNESYVPVAGWLFNTPLHLRRIPTGSDLMKSFDELPNPIFVGPGARNVIIDTIKRGTLFACYMLQHSNL
jgi:alpha-mannosidase